MYTYWPYPNYPPYFTGYCPCCGRPWQNPYMTTATWNVISNYGDMLKEQEKAADEKSTDVKKDD